MSSRRDRKAAARAARQAANGAVGRRPWPLAVRVTVALAVGIALGFALRMLAEGP